jgi:HEPN domain-containing protein
MTANRNLTAAQRWLRHDRDAARLNRDHGFHEHACFVAQQSAANLADQALADLDSVVACVERFVTA